MVDYYSLLMIESTLSLIGIVVWIFFLNHLSNTLAVINQQNRYMEPWKVWLNLVPILNFVWIFVTVHYVSNSIRLSRVHSDADITGAETGFYGQGIAMAIFLILALIPIAGLVFWPLFIITWALYWRNTYRFRQGEV